MPKSGLKSNGYSAIRIKPRAPYETAKVFCDHRAGKPSRALVRYRNTWYQWTGSHYRKLDTEIVRAELWSFLAEATVRERQAVLLKEKMRRRERNG